VGYLLTGEKNGPRTGTMLSIVAKGVVAIVKKRFPEK